MCRGRRARILLHLHIQREKRVLRGVCVCLLLQDRGVCLLLQYLLQSCREGDARNFWENLMVFHGLPRACWVLLSLPGGAGEQHTADARPVRLSLRDPPTCMYMYMCDSDIN